MKKKTIKKYSRQLTKLNNTINNSISNNLDISRISKTTKSNKLIFSKTYKLTEHQIEFLLLINILILFTFNMKIKKISDKIIASKLSHLLKQIRKNNKFIPQKTTTQDLELFMNLIIKYTNILINELPNELPLELSKKYNQTGNTIKTIKHKGGFFFKSIEDKSDKPITGADITKLLDEIQQFFYNAQYVEEGQFLQDTNTVLSMLRGDTQQFKGILQYRIFPQYYQAWPPFIKWDNIKEAISRKKYEDIPDYLLAYQTYLRLQDEYLVEKGLKPASVLSKDLYTGFYNNLANSLNDNIYKFQAARRTYQGQFFPITVPP